MTHSPAPWRYVPKSGQIVDANNRQICRIWHTSNRERDHANGELIALAPTWYAARNELQTALELAVRAIDELLPGAAKIPCDIGLINEALTRARPLTREYH